MAVDWISGQVDDAALAFELLGIQHALRQVAIDVGREQKGPAHQLALAAHEVDTLSAALLECREQCGPDSTSMERRGLLEDRIRQARERRGQAR